MIESFGGPSSLRPPAVLVIDQLVDHGFVVTRPAERRGTARRGAFEWTPEAERMRSALEMHKLGVQLYRQRMRREYPKSSSAEIDGQSLT